MAKVIFTFLILSFKMSIVRNVAKSFQNQFLSRTFKNGFLGTTLELKNLKP